MNIRCSFCQMPYTLSRIEMLDALQEMEAHKLTHYDAHCPRCRRATPIPRQRLEMAMPNWQDALKQFETEMKEHPQHEAPLPTHQPVPVAETESAPVLVEDKPTKKSTSKGKEQAPKKPMAKSKPASKPAAKAKATTASSSKGKKRSR